MTFSNLLAWSVQVLIVAAIGALLPGLFRLRAARARLWYWHSVLLACLALPLVEPWLQPTPVRSGVTFTTGAFRTVGTQPPPTIAISWPLVLTVILGAGIVFRLLWLLVGVLRLRSLRERAAPLEDAYESFRELHRTIAPDAQLLVSGEVSSPVTFGFWDAVVLLPERFRNLGLEERRSVICHELIHIQRRDWVVAIAEELVRSLLWFHPAIWWLLGRVQLTREQVVDEAVIEHTGDANCYLDALLAIASLHLRADLAPAPLFLKKRHLRQRVESILSGAYMTKRNLLFPLAAALASLPVVIGVAAWQFPLRAAPQEAVDDAGVEVQLNGLRTLHRTSVPFPDSARAKHLSGTVVANVTVDSTGEVTNARIVSGPEELRKSVVQSLLNWHFALESASAPHSFDVAVRFDGSQAEPPSQPSSSMLMPRTILNPPKTIGRISLMSLPASLRDKVTQAGVLHEGDTLTPEALASYESALRQIDDHLRISVMTMRINPGGDAAANQEPKVLVDVRLNAPVAAIRTAPAGGAIGGVLSAMPATSRPATEAQPQPPQSIRVGGNVQQANLVQQVQPVYPPLAKQAKIQGTVKFDVVIAKDGTMKNIQVISGHPMLVQAALDAVKNWVYKPTLLNGEPVEVITVVDVNFTLIQ